MLIKAKELISKVYFIESNVQKSIFLNGLANENVCGVISFLNMNSIVLAENYPQLHKSLMKSDYLFRDGVGVKKIQDKCGVPCGINMNGTDLIPEIMKALKERPMILIGATEKNASAAKKELSSAGFNIIKSINGYKSKDEILQEISCLKQSKVLVIIGMGSPYQEIISYEVFDTLKDKGISSLVVSGGAIIDRLALSIKRSPSFFVKFNIEWLYRLCREPKRLYKRNVSAIIYLFRFNLYYYKYRLFNKINIIINGRKRTL